MASAHVAENSAAEHAFLGDILAELAGNLVIILIKFWGLGLFGAHGLITQVALH